ncbi:hypothetical protein T492DRAFT_1073403 [Pavlovales sp. CCMP2436]|nr:hypothetical protein T492DRAFT_1073403 [Pavlovales sp. CCMP2436]
MVVHVRVAPPALGKAAAVHDSALDVMTKAFEDAGRVGELEQDNVGLQAQIITLQKQLTARNGASTSTAPSNTRSTTALMEPPAANPGARVIGKNASDRTVLTSASCNQTVTIKPKGNYNQHSYLRGRLLARRAHQSRRDEAARSQQAPGAEPAMIPYSTMALWATQDSRGVPKWLSCRDENHKNSLPYVEVEDAVRNTAIELRRVVAKTGKLYDSLTDVSTLVKSFFVRMAKEGIYFIEKHGRKLGLQHSLQQFALKINPELITFQKKYDVILTPEEQSPHWTLIIGFVGVVQMELLAIMKGTDNLVPSPFHAQLLKGGDGVYLGQTATGWVNNPLKLAFANLQIDKGIIGKRPIVINVDGHDSNLNNNALHKLMAANKVILIL